ncbi:MAG: ABC transporter permease [Nitrospinota bacterium]
MNSDGRGGAWLLPLALTGLAVLAAFAVSAGFILLIGRNPATAFQALVLGAFGSKNSLAEMVVKTSPLLLVGLGIAFAFRGRVWNIGAEGQLFVGALASTAYMLQAPATLPKPLMLTSALLAGFLGGAIFSAIPAILRAFFGINEIIVTILLNYVAIYGTSYFIHGPMRTTEGPLPLTDIVPDSAVMPILVPDTRLHAGILIGVGLAFVVHLLLWRTSYGYEVRVVGANPDAAAYAGIPVARSILLAMVVSGGLAGMAGMVEVSAIHRRLLDGISPGYGFMGIVVALLGKLNPIATIFASLLFAGLLVGADSMQRAADIPVTMVYVIQGLVVLMVLGTDYFLQRRQRGRTVSSEDSP